MVIKQENGVSLFVAASCSRGFALAPQPRGEGLVLERTAFTLPCRGAPGGTEPCGFGKGGSRSAVEPERFEEVPGLYRSPCWCRCSGHSPGTRSVGAAGTRPGSQRLLAFPPGWAEPCLPHPRVRDLGDVTTTSPRPGLCWRGGSTDTSALERGCRGSLQQGE